MILQLAIAIAASYAFLSIFQALYVGEYARRARRLKEPPQSWSGPVHVVLCLRGADPSLPGCLADLAAQRRSDFQLHCVYDRPEDPARAVVAQAANRFERAPQEHIAIPESKHRSLKCNSLLVAFRAILAEQNSAAGAGAAAVMLIDADTRIDPNGLEDLIGPLGDPAVGVTTGSRWFSPETGSPGCWLRQIWNAAAIVQMELYKIPWGGCLAFRTDLLRNTDWMERLETAFCEDTLLDDVLCSAKLKMVRVPKLVLDNAEDCTVSGAYQFIVRQLLTMRLYHRAWPWVVCHGLSIGGIHLAALAGLIAATIQADGWAVSIILGSFVLFQAINFGLLHWIGRLNRRWLARRQGRAETSPWIGPHPLNYGVALGIAQFAHPGAVVAAAAARQIEWRGVIYRLKKGKHIQRVPDGSAPP